MINLWHVTSFYICKQFDYKTSSNLGHSKNENFSFFVPMSILIFSWSIRRQKLTKYAFDAFWKHFIHISNAITFRKVSTKTEK